MHKYGGAVSFVGGEKGGVTIFAKKFAMITGRGARHAQKVELRREAKLRKKVLPGIEI